MKENSPFGHNAAHPLLYKHQECRHAVMEKRRKRTYLARLARNLLIALYLESIGVIMRQLGPRCNEGAMIAPPAFGTTNLYKPSDVGGTESDVRTYLPYSMMYQRPSERAIFTLIAGADDVPLFLFISSSLAWVPSNLNSSISLRLERLFSLDFVEGSTGISTMSL